MRVCLMVEGQEGVTWPEWLALASACEELGFDGLFRSDHYESLHGGVAQGALDAWTTIAALAARTERIRLGTLVSPVTFRHPAVLAKSVAAVDHVSGGRVEVGLGAGWYEREHRAFGLSFPARGERLEMLGEQVEIVHRLLDPAEQAVTFRGKHYRLEDCEALPAPLQRPHPPLILGGEAGARSSRLAVRWADEYNVFFCSPARCREARLRLDEECAKAGRDPSTLPLSLMTGIVVCADAAALSLRLKRIMDLRGGSGSPGSGIEHLLGRGWIVGRVEQVLEQMAVLAAAGISRVMLQLLDHGDRESLELLGREVVTGAATL
ncbi:MAG: TIGR03560 family F420-dependent LLM class oxidoreductase [Actinomycetota bacterium]|nr:TIGR03560 family F420-dependent LLM class oxidoreductase [Actinomycetota bacterium]